MQTRPAEAHDAYATDYDRQVLAYRSYITEVLFGLCYEYIVPGRRLLDIGTGTGLAALPFARAGLRVFGIDASPKMLLLCRAKGFTDGLAQYDLGSLPWPCVSGAFDYVTACGVLHFLDDLPAVFGEVARLARPGGVFAFTTKAQGANAPPGMGVFRDNISGFAIYEHSQDYIERLSAAHGFEILKSLRLFVMNDLMWVFVTCRK